MANPFEENQQRYDNAVEGLAKTEAQLDAFISYRKPDNALLTATTDEGSEPSVDNSGCAMLIGGIVGAGFLEIAHQILTNL